MEEAFPLYESHPQKEKVEKYAESFQKLADTFYGMPYRKDYLSSGQVEQILKDTGENVCTRCYQQELCWREKVVFEGGREGMGVKSRFGETENASSWK